MDRRTVLGFGVTAALAGMTRRAFAEGASGVLSTDPTEIIPLWPGVPPGGEGVNLEAKVVERSSETGVSFPDRFVSGIGKPTLEVFRPQKPDGSAAVVIPGGGYGSVAIDREGVDVARRLNASGVTVFVLCYRLPAEGWANAKDVPLQDAQRAMRIIRAGAQGFGVDPNRVGVFGSSAGGHLAASLATRCHDKVYEPFDNIDALDAKPAFASLMYPVITMSVPGTHAGSRLALLGPNPTAAIVDRYSCDKLVTDNTPPCFICMVANDDVVPPMENGLTMFRALHAAKVPVELHVFEKGKHGFGIRLAKGLPVAAWPELFLRWGYSNGWFRDSSAAPV